MLEEVVVSVGKRVLDWGFKCFNLWFMNEVSIFLFCIFDINKVLEFGVLLVFGG